MIVCIHVTVMQVSESTCGVQKATFTWIQEIEFSSPGLYTSPFTHWAISLTPCYFSDTQLGRFISVLWPVWEDCYEAFANLCPLLSVGINSSDCAFNCLLLSWCFMTVCHMLWPHILFISPLYFYISYHWSPSPSQTLALQPSHTYMFKSRDTMRESMHCAALTSA